MPIKAEDSPWKQLQSAREEFFSQGRYGGPKRKSVTGSKLRRKNTDLWAALTAPIWCLSPIFALAFCFATEANYPKERSKL
jgi:hypothetical protein